jgi:hypothetical protein
MRDISTFELADEVALLLFPVAIVFKKVMLFIEEHEETPDIFSLSSVVYNTLSPEDINDIEDIALDRNHFSRN